MSTKATIYTSGCCDTTVYGLVIKNMSNETYVAEIPEDMPALMPPIAYSFDHQTREFTVSSRDGIICKLKAHKRRDDLHDND